MNLPVGQYVPRGQPQGAAAPAVVHGEAADPSSSTSEPKFEVEEQLPSEYPEYYLKAESRRFMHQVEPMIATGLTGVQYGSHKHAETSRGFHINWQKMLGKGGFGSVYQGYRQNPKTKRTINYAIKVINRAPPDNSGPGQKVKELANEISNWEHCNGNPYIVRLVDNYAVQNQYVFVMEWAAHGDFMKEMKKQPDSRFTVTQARFYFRHMVNGVNYLHARGVAHRDIKLDNFLLCADPRDKTQKICKVIDFGMSSVAWTTNDGPIFRNNSCGTVRYMPPEILVQRKGIPQPFLQPMSKDRAVMTSSTTRQPPFSPTAFQRLRGMESKRPASGLFFYRDYCGNLSYALNNDTWALGITLFTMVAGGYPFWTADLPQGLHLICKARFARYRHMPLATREFVRCMLEPDPQKRATCKDIMNHDWMKDNPFARKDRQSQEPDHSTVPPPYQPPSSGSSISAGPLPSPYASPAGSPVLGRARAGAIVQPSTTSAAAPAPPSQPTMIVKSSSPAASSQSTPPTRTPSPERRMMARFFAGGTTSSSSQPVAKGGTDLDAGKVHAGTQSPDSRHSKGTSSTEARAKFFMGADPGIVPKKSSSGPTGQKAQFFAGGTTSSSEPPQRKPSGGKRVTFFTGASTSSSEPQPLPKKQESKEERKLRHQKHRDDVAASVTWTPSYPGEPDPYAGVVFPVLSDSSGSSDEEKGGYKTPSASSGTYQTASETQSLGSGHAMLGRTRSISPKRAPAGGAEGSSASPGSPGVPHERLQAEGGSTPSTGRRAEESGGGKAKFFLGGSTSESSSKS